MAAKAYNPTLDFNESPTVVEFLHDQDNLFNMIIGPVGSGKSYACCAKIGMIAAKQLVYPGDKYRRSRFAIIRNTTPELRSTTIETWKAVYSEDACGPIVYSAPISHHIIVRPRGEPGDPDFVPGIDMEVLFIALDKPKDIRKLRSLDVTAVWINEGKEVGKGVFMMSRRRRGRFPKRLKGTEYMAQEACVISDTNSPDEDHWIAQMSEDPPEGWSFHHQPPAVFELEQMGAELVVKDPEAKGMVIDPGATVEWLRRRWCVNPRAENLANLITGYYHDQITGSNLDEIRRDLQARFHYVQDGKPVIPEFEIEIYVVDELPVLKGVALQAGLDIGGGTLNPAACVGQHHPRGPWLIHDCMDCQDLGLVAFSDMFKVMMAREHFAGHKLSAAWGDPAGDKRDELFETIIFDHLKTAGIAAKPAPTDAIGPRIEAIKAPMGRMYEGKPGLIIHRRCKKLIKALGGAWYFKRMQVSGEDRYQEIPDKSHPWSDLGDALGYLLLGGGEYKQLTRGDGTSAPILKAPVVMNTEFNIFDA